MMKTIKIYPNPNCRYCHGKGEINDWVDYGSTRVPMPSLCDCILDQLPDDFNDRDTFVEVVIDEYYDVPPGDFD
jgi:hypothetical protein